MIEGSVSQYSANSVSACTVISLEAAALLLENKKDLSPAKVDNIVHQGSSHSANVHLDVDEGILLNGLKDRIEVDSGDYNMEDFSPLLTKLKHNPGLVACVTTASVTFLVARDLEGDKWILFDSHPRDCHPHGSAFVIFETYKDLFNYIHVLFPKFTPEEGFDLQQFNLIDILYLKKKESSSSSSSSSSSRGEEPQTSEEMKRKLREKAEECDMLADDLQKERKENDRLLEEIEELKRQLDESNNAREAKDRELVEFKRQLEEFKPIVSSLKEQEQEQE